MILIAIRERIAALILSIRSIDVAPLRKVMAGLKSVTFWLVVFAALVLVYVGGYLAGHRGASALRASLHEQTTRIAELKSDLKGAADALAVAKAKIADLEKRLPSEPAKIVSAPAKKAARKP